MFSIRKLERKIYRSPEADSMNACEFPYANEEKFLGMESAFLTDEEKIHIFMNLSQTLANESFLDIYIWDYMQYPTFYKRFVICEGRRMTKEAEEEYLHYANEAKKGLILIDDRELERLYEAVSKKFPMWHFQKYSKDTLAEAMEHLYYASHRSGAKEILYKSQLTNIAFYIEKKMPEYNILGTSPTSILFDLPLRLLRILNQPGLINRLFYEGSIEKCRNVYQKYSDFIGQENQVSIAQWSYLEALYNNDGEFFGRGFNRALYNRLENQTDEDIVFQYGRFYSYKEMFPKLKIRLPKPEDVKNVANGLAAVFEYHTEKIYENKLIQARKKDTFYEYIDYDYMVSLPKDGWDYCLEAVYQGNCLMNYYIDRHARGELTILFLRKRKKPKESFVTIEISEDTIQQVYGKYNSLPDKDVFLFLEKYAREKGLSYNPRELLIKAEEAYGAIDKDLRTFFCLPDKPVLSENYYDEEGYDEMDYYQMKITDFITDFYS